MVMAGKKRAGAMKLVDTAVPAFPHLHRIIACEERLEEAVRFLAGALAKPRRGKKPVLLHSLRVGFWLLSAGLPTDVAIAGLLHDILEKTRVSGAQVSRRFGADVGHMVAAVTNDDRIRDPGARYADSVRRCIACGPGAILVRIADLVDNADRALAQSSRNRFDRIAVKLRMLLQVSREAGLDRRVLLELSRRLRQVEKVRSIALVPKKDHAAAKTARLPLGHARHR
jgi:(p)ppGpp synthase/HD superfamily hydrolase